MCKDNNKGDVNMGDLSIFIQQNKNKVRRVSEKNVVRNKNNVVVLSKDDEWRSEHEWDDLYKDVRNKK